MPGYQQNFMKRGAIGVGWFLDLVWWELGQWDYLQVNETFNIPLILNILCIWTSNWKMKKSEYDQSGPPSHTIRHVLNLSLIPFPWGCVIGTYCVDNLPCPCMKPGRAGIFKSRSYWWNNKLETFEDALSKREKFQHAKLKNEHSWYIMTETDRGKDW